MLSRQRTGQGLRIVPDAIGLIEKDGFVTKDDTPNEILHCVLDDNYF